jgi:hypothetical protein
MICIDLGWILLSVASILFIIGYYKAVTAK